MVGELPFSYHDLVASKNRFGHPGSVAVSRTTITLGDRERASLLSTLMINNPGFSMSIQETDETRWHNCERPEVEIDKQKRRLLMVARLFVSAGHVTTTIHGLQ
jgi:hypothetical protein